MDAEFRHLEYASPTVPWTLNQPIALGGTLERLWTLVQHLTEPHFLSKSPQYPWTAAQACMFILTGEVPLARGFRYKVLDSPYLRGATRISLVVDPYMTPGEVSTRYQQVREKVVPWKHRSMGEKHLRLAAFVSERPEDESWESKMKAWNSRYAEPRYSGYQYRARHKIETSVA